MRVKTCAQSEIFFRSGDSSFRRVRARTAAAIRFVIEENPLDLKITK